jgi:hypothetical protein
MEKQQLVTADELAAQAYFYGYPLILSDITFLISAARPQNSAIAYNQFYHHREFPDASFTNVVSPNADTLYSLAVLNLRDYPVVLSLPSMGDRYYLMQFMDIWTNVFASLGTRTSGNGAGDFLIAGPDWQGDVPAHTTLVRAPTNRAVIIGRTQTNGKADYETVHQMQAGYKLTSDAKYSNPAIPASADLTTPPKYQLEKMDAQDFFTRLNTLLKTEYPAKEDAPLLDKLRNTGIISDTPLDSLAPELREAIQKGYSRAKAALEKSVFNSGETRSWQVPNSALGNYGTNYTYRAVVARLGWGANLPADSVYSSARTDDDGNPLTGAHAYKLHFAKGELPPVSAFWSVTLYNDQQFFAANPINRYALGDRDDLIFNEDGSLDIIVQHHAPEHGNWLPAPEGKFTLMLRFYLPDISIVNGTWRFPSLKIKAD